MMRFWRPANGPADCCRQSGRGSLSHLEQMLTGLSDAHRSETVVSVMAANNETGVIQPLAEIGALCRYQVAFHSDMVQAFGKLAVDQEQVCIDFLSVSGHKIGGPTGIGAVWRRPGGHLHSLLAGGGQEQGRRSGTENLSGICGFAAAAGVPIQMSFCPYKIGEMKQSK